MLTLQQSDWHEVNVKVVEIPVPENANANVFKNDNSLYVRDKYNSFFQIIVKERDFKKCNRFVVK